MADITAGDQTCRVMLLFQPGKPQKICIIPGTYWKIQNFKQYELAYYFIFQGSIPYHIFTAGNGIEKLRHAVQT